MNILGLISQLIGIKTLRLTPCHQQILPNTELWLSHKGHWATRGSVATSGQYTQR